MVTLCEAQTTNSGINSSGLVVGDFEGPLKNLGLRFERRGWEGAFFYPGTTNVQIWSDVGPNRDAKGFQYNNLATVGITSAPSAVIYGTNILGQPVKCMSFGRIFNGTNTFFLSHASANYIPTSTNAFMYIIYYNSQTNGNGVGMVGWGCHTNASRLFFLPNQAVATAAIDYLVSTGGLTTVASTVGSGGTNIWTSVTTTYDGLGNWRCFRNLLAGTVVSPANSNVSRSYTLGGIGCLVSSNNINGATATGYTGFMGGDWMFVAGAEHPGPYTGTDVTNAFNFINTNIVYGIRVK